MTTVPVLNQKDGKKLELVQVLLRHGDRTPSEEEYSAIWNTPTSAYEPYGFGQLTNTGRMQAYQLGLILRERYKNYLNDVYKAEDLYAYSSGNDRTMTTLQLVLAGLYPPTSTFLWNPHLNWLPIPYRYTPPELDVLLKSFTSQTFQEIRKKETYHLIRAKNTEYSDIIKILQDQVGLNVSEKEPDFLTNIHNVLHSNTKMNIPLPEWCTRDMLARIKDYFVFALDCWSYTQQLKKINGGPLVKKFVDNMNINETLYNPRKIYLYSGHDINIHAVIKALGVKDYGYPDYSSAIILEKLRDVDNRVYVRLVGRQGAGEEFRILKICNYDEFCPLGEFLRIAQDVMPSDEEMHYLENEFKGSIVDDIFLSDPFIKKK